MSNSELAEIVQKRESLTSAAFELKVVQEPKDGKAATRPEKARGAKWPLDPPPVIEFIMHDGSHNSAYMHSPYWFCTAELESVSNDRPHQPKGDNVTGSLVSSLHKVKLNDNKEHAFFIFGDLNAKQPGSYRALFTLYEMRIGQSAGPHATKLQTVSTNCFPVHPTKTSIPARESTQLSKLLCEAGVKLRIRKESSKRKIPPVDWSSDKQTAGWHNRHMPPPPMRNSASFENISHRLSYGEGGLGIRNMIDGTTMATKPASHAEQYVEQQAYSQAPATHSYNMAPQFPAFNFNNSVPQLTSGNMTPSNFATWTPTYQPQPELFENYPQHQETLLDNTFSQPTTMSNMTTTASGVLEEFDNSGHTLALQSPEHNTNAAMYQFTNGFQAAHTPQEHQMPLQRGHFATPSMRRHSAYVNGVPGTLTTGHNAGYGSPLRALQFSSS